MEVKCTLSEQVGLGIQAVFVPGKGYETCVAPYPPAGLGPEAGCRQAQPWFRSSPCACPPGGTRRRHTHTEQGLTAACATKRVQENLPGFLGADERFHTFIYF